MRSPAARRRSAATAARMARAALRVPASRAMARLALAAAALAQLAAAQSPLPTLAPDGVARFSAGNVLVTRGGTPGGATGTAIAYGVSVVEYTPAGQAVQSVALSTNASRCGAPWTANYAQDHFAQVCGRHCRAARSAASDGGTSWRGVRGLGSRIDLRLLHSSWARCAVRGGSVAMSWPAGNAAQPACCAVRPVVGLQGALTY